MIANRLASALIAFSLMIGLGASAFGQGQVGAFIVGKTVAPISKSDIVKASADFQDGRPVVKIKLSAKAAKILCALTTGNISKQIKIVIAGKVVVDAAIQSALCDGEFVLAGRYSIQDTQELAKKLRG